VQQKRVPLHTCLGVLHVAVLGPASTGANPLLSRVRLRACVRACMHACHVRVWHKCMHARTRAR